jgi:arylsulfatase A-like enzyme
MIMTKLNLTIRIFLTTVAICVALPVTSALADDKARPNIIFIMSDDHAANAISAYERRLAAVFKTPNIDRIASEGMRFEGMFAANSICTPSRASIMTGQYSHVNGVKTLDDDFDRERDNLAKQLQAAGYETAIVGKWHLHTEPSGFDYYNVLPGQGRYHDPKLKEIGGEWQDHAKGGTVHQGYATDVITDLALEWLDGRETDKPFFLMLHHKAPHGLWEPAKRHEDLFSDVRIPEPDSLYNRGKHGPGDDVITDGKKGQQFGSSISRRMEGRGMVTRTLKEDWPTGPIELDSYDWDEVTSVAYQKYLKDYLRTLVAVDENVGRVLDYLDQNGLTDDTLVIYTSDQGMMLGEHDYYDKRWIYEESIQMPFVARYPGVIPQGTTTDELFLNVDIAPTLLDIAGADIPESVQGSSFMTGLEDPAAPVGRDAIYYRYWLHMAHHFVPAHYGIRTRTHKLAFFYGLPLDATGSMPAPTQPYFELYDLSQDPLEMNNVYGQEGYEEIETGLKTRLLEIKQDIGDTDEQYADLITLRNEIWNR